ncbi:MAG: DUF4292 domain-containing protein [Bacteroidia bacterium]|nr:DUF4292 domain-containing protein [Bacteroidia bacterium]
MLKRFKYSRLLCIIVLTITTLNGCHLVKKTVNIKKPMSEDESLVRRVVNVQPDWEFVEIRMTGKAELDESKFSFMGTVKMEKDRQIYILLRSTIGIEVGRIYANRDSVWLVSRVLNIKEKGDWKMITVKLGYAMDFSVIQGILIQSLFTSSGDQISNLLEDLVAKNDQNNLHLVSNGNYKINRNGIKYLNDFLISKETLVIDGVKIRDVNGQWIADIKYIYNKEKLIKKIEVKGIDSEHNFEAEINMVKREMKGFIEINFDKFK